VRVESFLWDLKPGQFSRQDGPPSRDDIPACSSISLPCRRKLSLLGTKALFLSTVFSGRSSPLVFFFFSRNRCFSDDNPASPGCCLVGVPLSCTFFGYAVSDSPLEGTAQPPPSELYLKVGSGFVPRRGNVVFFLFLIFLLSSL